MSLKKRAEPERLQGDIVESRAYVICSGEVIVEFVHRINDACEVEYLIHPDWNMIDKLQNSGRMHYDFPGIAIDPAKRKEEYVKDHVPAYIRQRVPPRGRADIEELKKRLGIPIEQGYDPWIFVLASHGEKGDDFNIYTKEYLKEHDMWRGFKGSV